MYIIIIIKKKKKKSDQPLQRLNGLGHVCQ